MSAIYEEVKLVWGADDEGEPVEYTVTPDYSDVQAIENMGISILGVVGRMQRGDVPAGKVSEMVAYLLRKAGAKVSGKEVYAELMDADPDDFMYVCDQVVRAFIPSKKSGSPKGMLSRKKRPRRKKKTKT